MNDTSVENTPLDTNTFDDDMLPEYDFSGGVRGRYAKTLREQGYSIRVYNDDGTYSERRVLGEQTVVLEPDVQEYFPDSEAVNRALRSLIALIPQKQKRSRTVRKTTAPGQQRQTASGDSPHP